MADPAETASPDTSEVVDPASRGSLTVLDRAVERIADASLIHTSGVVTGSSGFGRRPSRVKVTKQDDRVRAAADITVRWPQPASAVADELRGDIVRGMSDSGLRTDSVDVHVGDFGDASASAAPTPGGASPAATSRPLAAPAATPLAILLSLVLLAGAAVLIRDALVGFSVITGEAWTATALDAVDGLTAASWMMPVGIAVGVVGLLLVIASLKWRARRYRPTELSDDVWVHKSDLKALIADTAAADTAAADTAAADTAVADTTLKEETP